MNFTGILENKNQGKQAKASFFFFLCISCQAKVWLKSRVSPFDLKRSGFKVGLPTLNDPVNENSSQVCPTACVFS